MIEFITLLLGEEPQEGYYDFLAESITEKILNYCNIDALPEGLTYTAAEMAAALSRAVDGVGGVASIKEGDSQVNYASAADSVVADYKAQLNRYRRIGTV